MVDIVPAVLAKSEEDLERQDSCFSEDILIHLDEVGDDVWTDLHRPFEVHIMVNDPDELAERWIERGAQRIIVHKLTDKVISLHHEVEIGLAVTMDIDLESIEDDIAEADFIQLMSIREIGEQGHPLDEDIFDRIRDAKALYPEKLVSVDGGIDMGNAEDLVYAGADRLVIGSSIMESADPQETLREFVEILSNDTSN